MKINLIESLLLFFIIFLTQGSLSAQTSYCDSSQWAKKGTYEIVTIPGTVEAGSVPNFLIPNTTLCEIEKMRKKTETVEYKLNYCTLIRIYPKDDQTKTTLQK